jgi:Group II intron, maturase-specific domain
VLACLACGASVPRHSFSCWGFGKCHRWRAGQGATAPVPDYLREPGPLAAGRLRAHTHTSFTFLGYTFQPRGAIDNAEKPFLGFSPAVSVDALAKMSAEVRRWRLHLHTGHDLAGLAAWLNPIVAGWMNYYGRFYRSRLYPLLQRINTYLMRWAGKKYKRLRGYRRFHRWWFGIVERDPELFAHWRWDPARLNPFLPNIIGHGRLCRVQG